jgi:hypothetical protein
VRSPAALELRGERQTPTGTQDATEPRRGALAAAPWSGSGQLAPPNTQDAARYQTCKLNHAGCGAYGAESGLGGYSPRMEPQNLPHGHFTANASSPTRSTLMIPAHLSQQVALTVPDALNSAIAASSR